MPRSYRFLPPASICWPCHIHSTFTATRGQVLREVERVLVPEGRVILTGFNPWSLWGGARLLHRRQGMPWCGHFLNLPRLKDWLALLGLEPSGGRVVCYAPPLQRQRWLERFELLELAGNRWWPVGGGVYCLEAVKRMRGVRLITPGWKVKKRLVGDTAGQLVRRQVDDSPEKPLR